MDTYSAAETARLLGTTVPRIKRAISDLDLDVSKGRHGRVKLRPAQVKRLASELGVSETVPGLSRLEVQVLAALARAPLGLVSVRAVARRAGVSPTAAGRTLDALIERGLVQREREWIAAGRASERDVYRAAVDAPEWPALAAKLARVRPSSPPAVKRDRRVPAHLRHLFWNTAPSQLDTAHAGGYIARRLLSTGDLSGIAWGSANLTAKDWEHAAETRGLEPSQRALALNLAHASMLNGVFSETRLQFLHADEGASPQRLLETPTLVEGLRIASISDLLAMKLKVIGDRGEARDYFDLMTIERETGRRAEEGLGLYLARYNVPAEQANASIAPIIRALGYFGDVEEDEALPIPLAEIERYWQRRQPEIIAHLDRFGAVIPAEVAAAPLDATTGSSSGQISVGAYRRADGRQVREHKRSR